MVDEPGPCALEIGETSIETVFVPYREQTVENGWREGSLPCPPVKHRTDKNRSLCRHGPQSDAHLQKLKRNPCPLAEGPARFPPENYLERKTDPRLQTLINRGKHKGLGSTTKISFLKPGWHSGRGKRPDTFQTIREKTGKNLGT